VHTLSRGGSFEAFSLSTNTPGTLRLPPGERRFFRDVADLSVAAAAAAASGSAATLVPKAKNFAAIDVILAGPASFSGCNITASATTSSSSHTTTGSLSAAPASSASHTYVLINATLDMNHGLLVQGKRATSGVAPLCSALGIAGTVNFVWAVPDDRFEEFCRKGKPAPLEGGGGPHNLRVEQYIVRVPPPQWPSSRGAWPAQPGATVAPVADAATANDNGIGIGDEAGVAQ
jgi:hypothetical protein